jgi:cytochrome oxidase assembly protein ShyY1
VYRFVLRPKWILSHLLVLAIVVLFVNLGFWQLRRLDQRKAFNDTIRTALAEGPRPLTPGVVPDEWQRVELRGTFRPGTDVLVANRAQNDETGYWVLSAFDTAEGTVVVDRGFVARSLVAQGSLQQSVPPAGEVSLVGTVQKSRHGVFATSVGPSKVIEISQVDVPKLAERWGTTSILPFWVHATTAQGSPLDAVRDPTLNNGPHLSYAIQWFIFATIAVIGYPLILRRNARARALGIGPSDDAPL